MFIWKFLSKHNASTSVSLQNVEIPMVCIIRKPLVILRPASPTGLSSYVLKQTFALPKKPNIESSLQGLFSLNSFDIKTHLFSTPEPYVLHGRGLLNKSRSSWTFWFPKPLNGSFLLNKITTQEPCAGLAKGMNLRAPKQKPLSERSQSPKKNIFSFFQLLDFSTCFNSGWFINPITGFQPTSAFSTPPPQHHSAQRRGGVVGPISPGRTSQAVLEDRRGRDPHLSQFAWNLIHFHHHLTSSYWINLSQQHQHHSSCTMHHHHHNSGHHRSARTSLQNVNQLKNTPTGESWWTCAHKVFKYQKTSVGIDWMAPCF